MKKSIVKGIAVSLVLCYVPAVLVLYFIKFIGLDFSNIKDIAKIVAPFAVLLIGAALLLSGKLDRYIEKDVGTNPEFDKLLEKIMSDLESLVNEPVGQDNFKDTVESISESHEEIRNTGPVFFFSEFRAYFDSLLDYVMRCKAFRTSEGELVIDKNKLRRLGLETPLMSVLSAQLIIKNPMLSILYPEDKISYIKALSQISIESYSGKERKNAAKGIKECLNAEVYGCTSYSQLSDKISRMSDDMIKKENLLNGISISALKSMNSSKREVLLIKLLTISRLKYYCIISSDVMSAIANADRTICQCGKDHDLSNEITKLICGECCFFSITGDIVIFEMREGRVIKAEQPKASVDPIGALTSSQEKGQAAASLV